MRLNLQMSISSRNRNANAIALAERTYFVRAIGEEMAVGGVAVVEVETTMSTIRT